MLLSRWKRVCLLCAAAVLRAQQPHGYIHATVVDPSGAAWGGIGVEVLSPNLTCTTKSDGLGKFTCSLPPGVYRLQTTDANLMPYRRAPLTVLANDHLFVTIRPVIRGAPAGLPDPRLNYEVVQVSGGEAVIQYSSTVSTGLEPRRVFRGPNLLLSMETLAVSAVELVCPTPILRCQARGSVVAEIGGERLEGVSVDVDLVQRKMVLSRDASVERRF
jgi:hypothetical protein